LALRATGGKVLLGDLHILDENMKPCPIGTPGTVWFKTATPFEYFNDPNKTKEARSPDGSMSTVGDVGYIDSDGYLYLTDRATFMIISGGVNIYPQECENLLITHPKIADAAVFGVPNPDLGEEVKAVVQPMPGVEPCPDLAEELISFCSQSLSRQKVPRSIDSRRNCRGCRPGNSTSGCYGIVTGATRVRELCEVVKFRQDPHSLNTSSPALYPPRHKKRAFREHPARADFQIMAGVESRLKATLSQL